MKSNYLLQLADNQSWELSATKEASPWLNSLAQIMGLSAAESNGHPKIFFTKDNILQKDDWLMRDFRVLKLWLSPISQDAICDISGEEKYELNIVRMWYALFPIYQAVITAGGLPMHAALIEKDGQGLLIAAPGNTGKSTCCRRIPPPWKALCDDEVLLVRDKNGNYFAHPMPTWSDHLERRSNRTWKAEEYVPLEAIFFLEKAEKDEVLPIGEGEAAMRIKQASEQINSRVLRGEDEVVRKFRSATFNSACRLAKAVPAYTLKANLTGRFWEEMAKLEYERPELKELGEAGVSFGDCGGGSGDAACTPTGSSATGACTPTGTSATACGTGNAGGS